MASVNQTKKSESQFTYEGKRIVKISDKEILKRTVLTSLLGEDTFYESGQSIKDRIHDLIQIVDSEFVKDLMLKAKNEYHLRHVPLWMYISLSEKANQSKKEEDKAAVKSENLTKIITRVDDMAELLSLYWLSGKRPIPKQMRKGLAESFDKFDEYQFGKYKGQKKQISLKDVMMLTHPKATGWEKNFLYRKIVDNSLKIPLTWETELSAGKDKKETFEKLMKENRLGGLALLRNLRNMNQSQVDIQLMADSISRMNPRGIMPYNFYTANKYSNGIFKKQLESKMFESAEKTFEKLKGLTLFLIDTSGSMSNRLSSHSDVSRAEAAASLAAIIEKVSEFSEVYSFDTKPLKVNSSGFDLANQCSLPTGETNVIGSLNKALSLMSREPDRIIIITDEQTGYYDKKIEQEAKNIKRKYIINVAPYQNGIEYKEFVHVHGFSDGIFKYIAEYEKEF